MSQSAVSPLRPYVIPVTVMLAFISFWRASAVVLCDLGSSAYYVGGIAEQAIGKSAPWFILAIMLFSYAVRSIYIESCSMFVRGGVYRVVRQALGGTAAKFSVSALMFDYVLTGPISGVSAGLYLAALTNEIGDHFRIGWLHVPAPWCAASFAIAVTLYFWYANRIGLAFSSTRALRIMQLTTVMVVVLVGWSLFTLATKGFQPVPSPVPAHFHFSDDALGWFKGTAIPSFTAIAVLIGLGHSVLALSGEESLAQVNREIAAPKQKNLQRTGFIVFIYSLVFTSLVSFFAVMLIPDSSRGKYLDNLIGGLSMFLAGPFALRLAFHAFVVLVGVLMLSGAVNTAIIGSNGVLSRVAEDGVLPPRFREPHPKYGTTHRILNLIVGLQVLTIILSRGNVNMLGEAYAFGVVWGFAMKGLAVIVLRFTHPDAPRWRMPLNLKIGRMELPLGLLATTATLFLMALTNLFTKKAATISGVTFSLVFFALFSWSERKYAEQQKATRIQGNPHPDDAFQETERERFQLHHRNDLSPAALCIERECVVVAIERADDMRALDYVLDGDLPDRNDIVVVKVHTDLSSQPQTEDKPDFVKRVFGDDETDAFSEAVFAAEKQGKPVKLLAVADQNADKALLDVAIRLRAVRLVLGTPNKGKASERRHELERAWCVLPGKSANLQTELVTQGGTDPEQFTLVAAEVK